MKMEDQLELDVPEQATVRALLERLISIYGDELKKLIGDAEQGFRVMVVVNGKMAELGQDLKEGDEIFLILPAAGG